jgi:hypothetical protein
MVAELEREIGGMPNVSLSVRIPKLPIGYKHLGKKIDFQVCSYDAFTALFVF